MKKETVKKVACACGFVIGAVAVCCICDKLFKNNDTVQNTIPEYIFDYQEFWLKDGTNVFVHTCNGKIDQVEFNYQSFDSLIEAAKSLKELAADMGYDTAQEFEHVTFSEFCS